MIIGLDPSFKGLGMTFIDIFNKRVYTKKLSEDLNRMTFADVCYAVDLLTEQVNSEIGGRKVECVITETPPPTARFSAGLYALDYAIRKSILERNKCWVYGVSCSYIGHLHKKRKWSKSESVKLAKEIVDKVLKPAGFNCDSIKFESNQCESLLIAMRGAYRQGYFREVTTVVPQYADKLEFELF